MTLEQEPQPTPPDTNGQGPNSKIASANGALFLSVETYVRWVAERTCDPQSQRALQIMYGLGACVGGDQLLNEVCDAIARRMEE